MHTRSILAAYIRFISIANYRTTLSDLVFKITLSK